MSTTQTAAVRKGALLALLAASQFVVVLDASIANVALPSIGRALAISQDGLSWVVNAYTLTFGGFLLLGGRLADLLGRRRVYMAGLILFGIASFLGGLSQSEPMLIAARALQGLGAALALPGRAVDPHRHLHRGLGAQQGARSLGRGRGRRRRGRRAARRHPHRVPELALGAARQRADRRHGGAARAAHHRRVARERAQAVVRRRGRRLGDAGVSLLVYSLVDANNNGWGSELTIALMAWQRCC